MKNGSNNVYKLNEQMGRKYYISKYFLIITHFLYFCVFLNADQLQLHKADQLIQNIEQGFRIIKTFSTKEIGFGSQNFCVLQGKKGNVYIGNLHGVVIYDGARWSLTTLPNDSAVIKMGLAKSGTIMIGGVGELGILRKNKFNKIKYISLKNKIPLDARKFGAVNQFFVLESRVFIHTDNFFFEWEKDNIKIIFDLSKEKIRSTFFTYEKKLFRQTDTAVTVVGSGTDLSVDLPSSRVLYELEKDILLLENGTVYLTKDKFTPVLISKLESFTKNTRVSSICYLKGGGIAIGTREKGLLLLGQKNKPIEIINTKSGLPLNDIRGLELTHDGFLWIALNTGVAVINIGSHISVFDIRSGITSEATCLLRFKGTLYFGTFSGLHTIEAISNNIEIESNSHYSQTTKIKGPNLGIWHMIETFDHKLMVGGDNGLFILEGDKLKSIQGTNNLSVYFIKQLLRDPKTIYIGCSEGLALISKNEKKWQFRGLVPGMPNQIRSIYDTNEDGFWLGTTFEGAWHFDGVQKDEENYRPKHLKQVGQGEIDLFMFKDEICFSTKNQCSFYNKKNGKLEPHPYLGADKFKSFFFKVVEDYQSQYWLNTYPITKISFSKKNNLVIDDFSYRNLPGIDFQEFYPEKDGTMWIISDEGLVKIKEIDQNLYSPSFAPKISSVLYGGKLLPIRGDVGLIKIPYSSKRMRFKFAPMNSELSTLFQYRLEPIEENWSSWSKLAFAEYTNLWEGTYKLKMRMKRKGGLESEDFFIFQVLPPYYRTHLAYASYIFFLIFIIFTFVKWRSYRLEKNARVLKVKVKERTYKLKLTLEQLKDSKLQVEKYNEQLTVANKMLKELSTIDGLTGIANRRYLDQFLEEELIRSVRLKTPTAVILFDIDYFKKLNDYLGHLEGDICLKKVAKILKDIKLRQNDLVARYGGEEFTVILPNCTLDRARGIAEKIRNEIENLNISHPKSPFEKLTASFGVAFVYANLDNNPLQLLKNADIALYKAKSNGRNRVETM